MTEELLAGDRKYLVNRCGDSAEIGTMAAAPKQLHVRPLAIRYVAERQARREITGRTPATYSDVLDLLVAHLGATKPVDTVTTLDVELWLRKSPSDATYRHRLSVTRGFWRWLVDEGHTDTNPVARLRLPRQIRYVPRRLPPSQPPLIFAASPDKRTRCIVVVLFQEAIRRAELASLQIGDIDFVNRSMVVHGKGGNERVVPITDEAMEAIEDYLAEHPATSGPLIRSYTNPRAGMTPEHIGALFRAAARAAKVRAVPHQARHTAAHDMITNGASLRDVQTTLGHANIATTSIYIGLSELPDLRRAMAGRRYKPDLLTETS